MDDGVDNGEDIVNEVGDKIGSLIVVIEDVLWFAFTNEKHDEIDDDDEDDDDVNNEDINGAS